MPRAVQMRVDYRNDGAYLLRLVEAVAKDTRQTPEWCRETERMVRELALRLIGADVKVAAKRSLPSGRG